MIQVIDTAQGIKELSRKMQGVTTIGYDLEFSPLNPHDNSKLFLISITFGGTAYVIDYNKVKYVDPILPFLTDKKVLKIGHNLSIDIKHTLHHLGVMLQNCYCTMVAEEVLTAGLDVPEIEYIDHEGKKKKSSFSLAALLNRYFGIALDKEIRNVFINYDGSAFSREVYEYAGKDTLYLERLYNAQQEQIKAKNLTRVINLEMRLLPHVARMEYNGIHFDIEKCKAGIPVTEQIISRVEQWLQDMFITQGIAKRILVTDEGYSCVRLTSWQQVLAAFNAIGITVTKTDKDELKEWDFRYGLEWNEQNKQETLWLDDETEEFDVAYGNAVLRHYAVLKALEKFKGTYLEGLQGKYHAPTGKIYPSFRQCGARATGRFSSNNPNFQNIIKPKALKAIGLGEYDVRGMFYAPEGYTFVQCDYEGIELVLLAIIAEDEALQDAILSDDTHKTVTAMIANTFGFPELPEGYKKIQPFETFRDVAKTKTYARIYGSGVKNLHRKLSIPLAQVGYKLKIEHVQEWFDGWAAQFPKAAHALEAAARDAVSKGYVETVLGRRRQWDLATLAEDQHKMYGAMRQGANSKVQGSAADLCKLALVRVAERIDPEQAWLQAQIHDELIVLSTNEYAPTCAKIVETEMVKAGALLWPNARPGLIKAEAQLMQRYSK